MPATSQQQVGSRGRCAALLLPLLLLSVAPRPGNATINIPSKYKIRDLKSPPVITAQPESVTTFSADDITLTCEATGNPPPTFRWVKDGVEFDPSKDPELSVSRDSGTFSLTAKDGPIHQYQGRYNCYASNVLGTAVSNEARIVTENTPTLQKEKKVSKKVEEGESVVLPCNPPNSTVAPVIHWMDKKLRHIQQNERVIQGRDGNLYFSHVTEADSRDDYTCNTHKCLIAVVAPKGGPTASNSVVRNRRPQMMRPTGPSSSYLVLSGQNLDLECIAQGLPSPKIQWIRKDGVLSESRTSKDSYDRVLRFKNISVSDSGEYQCTATNLQGIITHTYSVTVEAAPYWTKEPKSQLYSPGETVKLECKADGIPSPEVTWSINDIDPDPRRSVKHGVLTLKNVELSDTAVYQCKAVNKHSSILINAYVYVIELPPQILTEDGVMYSVAEGQMIELACETFGSPRPNVTWEGETWGALVANPRMSQLLDGSLQISNASLNDSGQYTCTVSNSRITITAELDVLNKTVIVKPPLALRIQRGKPATLTCEYQVDSRQDAPQVQWRKNLQKLTESSDSDKYMIDESTLIIPDVKEEDEGTYTCEVITTLDIAEASGSITVVDRPDPPTQIQMTEPKERSVTLSWTPGDDHNSPVLEYLIEFEETEYERKEWEELSRVSGNRQRTTLSLKPFLSYRFRVIAINDIGKSDPSMYTDVISTPAAQNIVRSFNGPGFEYKVMWRKVLGSGPSWHIKSIKSPPLIITDVGNFSAFEIKVQAVNEMGEGPEPKSTIGYSGEDYPLEAPLNVGVDLISSTAIKVVWAPIKRETVRGRLQGYKISLMHYGPESRREHVREGKPSNISFVMTDSNEEMKVLGDLLPYSHYALSVSVINNKGEGPQSDPLTFHTPEGVPGPPSSLLLDSPSETEMILHWTPPSQPNGILKGYILRYQQGALTDSLIHFHQALKLDPHSRYRFYLRGYTSLGEGLPIIREGATTLDGVPPSNISLSTGETSVNLTWVSKERQRNVGFFIHYLKKDGTWKHSERVNSSQSFYTLRGLQSGSEYRLKIDFKNKTLWEDEIQTAGAKFLEVRKGFVTESWFIGLISALVLLLLVLLILCFIKRSKGGKYSVKEKEEGQIDSEARPMNNEGFGEYSDNEEKRTASQPSLCEDSKLCTDDALDDYANSNSVQTEVIMDESLASQSSGVRDVPDPGTQESSPLNPATPGQHRDQTWIHILAQD
uniref:Neural cell adhesion molecule L1 n=1 Tax=Cyprinus carpio TaxID=7962 RepID=A0A8C2HCW9_CYPCA